MNALQIAYGLDLPLELAGRTQGILAQKGAGKTYTAMRETELLLSEGQQVVALDPTGVWWGLRSPAPSGGKGFPVLVMGGQHGDLPLESTAGAIVADFIIESRQSVVLDLSHFESNAAQNRFVTDFAERLYRQKANDRRTVHLMLDEADSFCPQRPQPGEQRMLGAFEAIVRRGRSRGVGITLISQRPAVLNKNVMSQVDLLICLRITGLTDHKALREWTSICATAEQSAEFLKTLPTLKNGEAWFWSPSWLNIFERRQVTTRCSFDSSRTPDHTTSVAPARTVPVDLAKLSDAIKASVQRVDADNPRKLRARIAELEKKLSSQPEAKPMVDKPTRDKLSSDFRQVEKALTDTILFMIGIRRDFAPLIEGLSTLPPVTNGNITEQRAAIRNHVSVPAPHRTAPASRQPATYAPQSNGTLGKAERAILTVLAQYHPEPVDKARLACIAGYSAGGGGFNNPLSKLRTSLLIEGSDPIALTQQGADTIGDVPPLPTGRSLLDHWANRLGKAESLILNALHDAGGTMDKESLAQVTGYAASGGGFNNPLSHLRTLQLISGTGGAPIKLAAVLL